MNREKLKLLLYQYFNNTISTADCKELLAYLEHADPEDIDGIIDQQLFASEDGPEFRGIQAQRVLEHIKSDSRFIHPLTEERDDRQGMASLYHNRWLRIAALVLICCSAGLYFLKDTPAVKLSDNKTVSAPSPIIITPGGNKATLTMADGKVISLEDAQNGLLAQSGKTSVRKTEHGRLVYNSSADADLTTPLSAEPRYNTLSTPKGGEYQVTLPDGTRVWINSASSLSFPVAFTGKQRLVKLTGEAYFEVAKDASKPFYVSLNNVQVRVFGTHFNIAAYNDDSRITTTLLEGSVQVTKNNKQSLLKPGQQAVVDNNSDKIAVSAADTDQVMAWKNGYFKFDDESIVSVMKKVSRWYDVEIDYRGHFDDQRFGGTFYRSKSITELLHHLEKIGRVHFKITGRRIVVME
jgi:transmembrane sensor